MSLPTYAMAGEQVIEILGAAGVRAWRQRRTVADMADILAVMGSPVTGGIRRLVADRRWECDRPAEPAASAAIDCEASATLREAQWTARVRLRSPIDYVAPRWCACAHRTVRRALREAADARVHDAHGVHLLLSIVTDAVGCGHQALSEAGLSPRELQASAITGAELRKDGAVRAPAQTQLWVLGALSHPRSGLLARRRSATDAISRAVAGEAARQAVRAGAEQIGAAHILAAIGALAYQHRRTTWVYRPGVGDHEEAGDVLARRGLEYPDFSFAVARTPTDPPARDRIGPWRLRGADPSFTQSGLDVFTHARSYVAWLNHPAVGSDHLLMGCLEADSPAVRAALAAVGVALEDLRADAARLIIASP